MASGSRTVASTVALVAMVTALLMVGGPASAHDQLVSSTPAPAERLDAAPQEIVLQFSEDVLTLGAVVLVADAEESNWAAAEPTLDGTTVRVPVRSGMPDAGYEIRWRVVSADGHPISGLIPFTIGNGEAFTSVAPGSTSSPAELAAQEQTAIEQNIIGRTALIGVAGAASALGLYALIIMIRRRKAARLGNTT